MKAIIIGIIILALNIFGLWLIISGKLLESESSKEEKEESKTINN